MRFIITSLLLVFALNSFGQQDLKAIKKAKTEVLSNQKLPFNIDRLKEGETQLAGGGMIYKKYVSEGAINILSINWYEAKSSSNQLANASKFHDFYYLEKSIQKGYYHQFFLDMETKVKIGDVAFINSISTSKSEMQLFEISKANIVSVLGEDYKDRINSLKKVTLSAVRKMVKEYNKAHPII